MDHHVFPGFQPGLQPPNASHKTRAMDAHATARTLMVQGTTSDAGKSALVTGLCRVLQRRGIRVAPFKPQNMALNSAVTADGGEIGRAQAVQAQACGLEPTVHMNPILLKPNTDIGAQVIVQGRALADMEAQDYHTYKSTALHAVLDSYKHLRDARDLRGLADAGHQCQRPGRTRRPGRDKPRAGLLGPTELSPQMARCSARICMAFSRNQRPVLPCYVGPACRRSRYVTTGPYKKKVSIGSPMPVKLIWISMPSCAWRA